MITEEIERNGNRTQTESGNLNGFLYPCRVIRTLSLAQEFTQCVSERDRFEPLQRDGDSLEQEWSLTVVVADGCEMVAQLLQKFHAFDVNGSKRFERVGWTCTFVEDQRTCPPS